jgi:hypothetical protein
VVFTASQTEQHRRNSLMLSPALLPFASLLSRLVMVMTALEVPGNYHSNDQANSLEAELEKRLNSPQDIVVKPTKYVPSLLSPQGVSVRLVNNPLDHSSLQTREKLLKPFLDHLYGSYSCYAMYCGKSYSKREGISETKQNERQSVEILLSLINLYFREHYDELTDQTKQRYSNTTNGAGWALHTHKEKPTVTLTETLLNAFQQLNPYHQAAKQHTTSDSSIFLGTGTTGK